MVLLSKTADSKTFWALQKTYYYSWFNDQYKKIQ